MARNRRDHILRGLHPIWRGVGCLMMVIIPIVSYFIADWGLNYMLVESPEFARNFTSGNYPANTLLYIRIGSTLVVSLLLFFITVTLSSLLISLWGQDGGEETYDQNYKDYRSRH